MPNLEKPMFKLKTNSPILPLMNSNQSILVTNQLKEKLLPMMSILTKNSSEMSTGLPQEKFNPSKIKDNVDLAGLSLQLPQPNLLPELKPELLETTLNKNSYPVVPFPIFHAHVWDVTEDKWTKDSDISKNTECVPNHLIHTPLNLISEVVHKKLVTKPLSQLTDTPMFLKVQPLLLNQLMTNNPYLLPSMPQTFLHIPVESSPTVELLSITESYLQDIPTAIG